MKEEVKEIRLADLVNIQRAIAERMILRYGEYRCTIGEQKVVVRR